MQRTFYVKALIIMSLLILLSSSSFFYERYLKNTVEQKTLSLYDIQQARNHGYFSDLLTAFYLLPKQNKQWLAYAYMLAPYEGEIAYQLAQHFNPQYLPNNVTALSLKKRQQHYVYWLRYSVKLQYVQAVIPLVNVLIEQKQYEEAQQILKPYHQYDDLLKKAFTLALNKGDKVRLKELKIALETKKSLALFVEKTNNYRIHETYINTVTSQNTCVDARTVQPYSTNINDLEKTAQLIAKLHQHPLAQYFCFLPVRYVPLPDLFCTHQGQDAIQCDETRWPETLTKQAVAYSIILLPRGGANVHGNIMYLDSHDTISVVVHELSHFLGFVDEYPLVKNHVFCQPNTTHKALNVTVLPKYWLGEKYAIRAEVIARLPWKNYIDDRTPILTLLEKSKLNKEQLNDIPKALLSLVESNTKKELWQLGTPIVHNGTRVKAKENSSVGVYPALTCVNNYPETNQLTPMPLQSVKALYERTALEYFELAFPQLYLALIEQHISD